MNASPASVNSAPEAAPVALHAAGATRLGRGTVTVLTSDNPLDENTFEQPVKVVPKTSPLATRGNRWPIRSRPAR